MYRPLRTALVVVLPVLTFAACGSGGAPAPERQVDQASAPAPRPVPEPTTEAARAPAPPEAPPVAPPVAPPAAKPAAPPAAPQVAPQVAKPVVRDPGGPVEVARTLEGVARIGAAKCKVCHKLQYESWSGSAHAKRNPPLDCEACHGPGSEYKAIAIMKDPAKALAAGLVMPAKAFCATCHQSGWTDAMLTGAHAHKPKI